MTRTMCVDLEERIGSRIPISCKVIPWLVHHAAFVRTRFNKSSDGTTPYYRLNGSQYQGLLCLMGEKVMLKIVKENKKLRPAWKKGIWLGKSELNDERFISTNEGIVSGRSVHRLPKAEFIKEDILELRGTPMEPSG